MNPGDVTSDRFVRTAVRRKKLFLVLSGMGVAIGLGLAVLYGYWSWAKPEATGVLPFVVVVLVLLNARANLRQYRFAAALERLLEKNGRD